MKTLLVAVLVSCCFLLLSSCHQQETAEISSRQSSGDEANPASSILSVVSYPPVSSINSQSVSSAFYDLSQSGDTVSLNIPSELTEQPSSALKTAFHLDIPADNAVKLSFFRRGANGTEIVDITEDIKTITTIIQKINQLEFSISSFSDDEIRMRNGGSSTIRIDYQDGLCKDFRNQGGWYQYTDYGEQWLEKKDGLDLEQFIADEMGVELWR